MVEELDAFSQLGEEYFDSTAILLIHRHFDLLDQEGAQIVKQLGHLSLIRADQHHMVNTLRNRLPDIL